MLRKCSLIYMLVLLMAQGHHHNLYGLNADVASMDAFQALITLEQEFKQSIQFLNEKRYNEALSGFCKVTRLDPTCKEAFFNIGLIHLLQKEYEPATLAFEKTIDLDPSNIQALLFLASLWQTQGQPDKSLKALQQIIKYEPMHVDAYIHMARIYSASNKFEDAAFAYTQAITCRPDNIAICFEAASLETRRGNFDTAMSHFKRILTFAPHNAEAHLGLSHLLLYLGRAKEAIPHLRTIVTQWPEHKEVHLNLGETCLAAGNFQAGWQEREWRLVANTTICALPASYWKEEQLTNKTILIRYEHNWTDLLQFCRYTKLLAQQGASNIIVEADAALIPLLATNPYINELVPVITSAQQLPYTDIQIPIASLPLVFKSTVETIPTETPYLYVPKTVDYHWKLRLRSDNKLKIGIAWQANRTAESLTGDLSIMPLPFLLAFLQTPGTNFYLLQQTDIAKDLLTQHIPAGSCLYTLEDLKLDDHHITDLAGLVNNLDLIITVDNDIAHLAGALAKPTWLLLTTQASWRWMIERVDSPWYPTMKLFRQFSRAEWNTILTQLNEELTALMAQQQMRSNTERAIAEVSVGELIDKITILEIKLDKISDETKRTHITNELEVLKKTWAASIAPSETINALKNELYAINTKLWDIEDAIRLKEQQKIFDAEFTHLARSVYKTNDERFRVKNEINKLSGSRLHEVKQLVQY